MATVTKRDLVLAIMDESGLPKKHVTDLLERLIEVISSKLANGEEVALRRFGKFSLKQNKARVGRNPNQPGKAIIIPPRQVVRFVPGSELKQRITRLNHNSGNGSPSPAS